MTTKEQYTGQNKGRDRLAVSVAGIWQYQELIGTLAVAELKNRYQNTALGFFWSILSPLLLTLVLFFVFRNLFQQEQNFMINMLVGLIAWRFFILGTNACLYSVASKPSLVTKVYIPRQILVLSSALANFIGSFLEFLVLLPIIYILIHRIPVTILLLPLIHIIYFWIVFGIGLLLSSLFIYFRDLNQIWDVLLNALFFACPIVYPLSIVPERLLPYYMLNPVTQLIEMYRRIMVAGTLPGLNQLAITIGIGTLLFFVGTFVFNKLQRGFAEEM